MTKKPSSSVQISGEFSQARITKRGVAIVIAGWIVYLLISTIPSIGTYRVSFSSMLLWQAYQVVGRFLFSIPVWFIVIHWMYKKPWYWKGFAHLLFAPLYTVVNYAYQYYIVVLMQDEAYIIPIRDHPGWILFYNFFTYILQFTLYHSYEILRQLRVKEKVNQELLTLKKEQELTILKSQINPHFLFNTLNSINAMASTDAEETRTMIAQLGDLLRYVIEGSKNNLVPLEKELKFVKDFVDLETKRLGDRLVTEFQIDRSLATFPVPPMILQPLVENAIKHGIAPLEGGGRVTVQIQKNKNTVLFRVSDTGVGCSSNDPLSTGRGIGLRNIDTRLHKIYGDSARLKINSIKNSGCEITFLLPLK